MNLLEVAFWPFGPRRDNRTLGIKPHPILQMGILFNIEEFIGSFIIVGCIM